MQKNLSKAIVALIAVSCIFYFFKRINAVDQNQHITASTTQDETYTNKLPEDFHAFYDNFHSDSLYQMNHIMFPLMGLGQSDDSIKSIIEKRWLTDDWLLHRPFNDQGGTFERSFTNVAGIITESITGNGGMFTMEKRYSKLVDEWYLIYYQELIMKG